MRRDIFQAIADPSGDYYAHRLAGNDIERPYRAFRHLTAVSKYLHILTECDLHEKTKEMITNRL